MRIALAVFFFDMGRLKITEAPAAVVVFLVLVDLRAMKKYLLKQLVPSWFYSVHGTTEQKLNCPFLTTMVFSVAQNS